MSKRIYLIAAFLVILAISIGGCSRAQVDSDKNPETKNENAVSNADVLLDDDIFLSAQRTKDKTKCEKIKAEAVKSDCVATVEAYLAIDEAVKKQDQSLCDSIKLKRYQEKCVSDVNEYKEKLVKINSDSEKIQEIQNQIDAIVQTGDLKKCNELKETNDKNLCQRYIIENEAVAKLDAKICEKMPEPAWIEACQELVKVNQ